MAGIEVEVFHDILIGLLILNFALLIFAASTLQQLNTKNANITALNTQMANINQAGNNVAKALNSTIVTENKSDTLYIAEVGLNVGAKIVLTLIALIVLVITDFGAFVIIVYTIIPSIFSASALGQTWGSVFGTVYSVALTILSIYFIYTVLVMFGFRKHSGH